VAKAKSLVDGERKQESLRGSKRLSVKGNMATLESERSSPAPDDEHLEVCRSFA
jgi:hypothetical protein